MLSTLGVRDLDMRIIWESGEFASDTQVLEAVYEMLRAVGVRPALQQFEPGGDISTWRQGKAGTGTCSPTATEARPAWRSPWQGMYAGTEEKEKTRDTYHGYVFPAITRQIVAASSEVDDSQPASGEGAARHLGDLAGDVGFAPKAVVARRNRVGGLHPRRQQLL